MSVDAPYLDYHVRWRAGGSRPGRHPARAAGPGGDFRACVPFWQLPDAARIDVRRSLMDPAGGLLVRQMRRRSAIDVILAVDVSRSMGALGDVAGLAAAAVRSVLKAGDRFGLLAFDSRLHPALCLPPSRGPGACHAAVAGLAGCTPSGRSADGVLDLGRFLPAQRCLVLLVSDFLLPEAVLGRALQDLAGHDLAPIVLHRRPAGRLPHGGLMRVRDAEGDGRRLLWLRPSYRRRMAAAERARRAALDAAFARYGRAGLHVDGVIDVGLVSQYLMRG